MHQSPRKNWNATAAIDWLLNEGRFLPSLGGMTQGLGDRLYESGAPLMRLRLSMRTLHPLIAAYSVIWERGKTSTTTTSAPHGLESRPAFIGSPMQMMGETGKPYRKNLTHILSEEDHSVLHEFKADGATDYYGIPLQFQANLGGSLTALTDDPSGFSDHDLYELERVATHLAPITELVNTQNTARAMADAYLGARSGKRVLEGQITRGHIETVQAATMICDIRNWTTISNQLPPRETLALVNSYFEQVGNAVEANQGEILKFIGDGVLAVFPVQENDGSPETACLNALSAAEQALASAATTPVLSDLGFGFGLDFGDVLYGNIGSETRLDFTVLGITVNKTARIEGMCSRLNERLLYSQEVADLLPAPSRLVATTDLKGFEGEFNILAPPLTQV